MTPNDYREMIGRVIPLMGQMRCADLADPHLYDDERDGERVQLPPQKLLIAMLEAFDRRLAILDRALFDRANATIREVLGGEWPGRVLVEQSREETAAFSPFVSLADAPDLSGVRTDLRRLIGQVREDYGEPDAGTGFEPEPMA